MLLGRREFLKAIGVISGGTAFSCNWMADEERLSAYLTPPREMTPGVAAYYATVCRACPAGCGILVKTREGRPIKLEGNPLHPVNKGALCARGQAAIQELYSRTRATVPLLRVNGRLEQVPWKKAVQAVAAKLRVSRSPRVLTGLESGAFEALVQTFLAPYPGGAAAAYEPNGLTSMAAASEILFGVKEVPRVDISKVTHLVSLGADFLDAWVNPVEFARTWAERHGMAADRALQVDYAGPRRNLTAVAADRWYPLASSQVGSLALSLLYGVYDAKRSTMGSEASSVGDLIAALGPRSDAASIDSQALKNMVDRLVNAELGLVLFGGADVIGRDATAVHAATLLTNYLLGSVGPALRYGEEYALTKVRSEADVATLFQRDAVQEPEVLVIYNANPVYSLPGVHGSLESRGKNRFTVCLASHLDETTAMADAVLPVHHPLETWGDYRLSNRIAGLMQPVRAPLHNTRHAGDLLMAIAAQTGHAFTQKSYKDHLIKHWTQSLAARGTAHGSKPLPELQWEELLVSGGLFNSPDTDTHVTVKLQPGARLPAVDLAVNKDSNAVELVVPLTGLLYDGRGATVDWLREVPDPLTQTAWDIPLEVAEDVAKKHGIFDGSLVRIKIAERQATVRAVVETGLAPGTVALRPGGKKAGARSSEATANPMDLLPMNTDPISGELARSASGVTLEPIAFGKLVSVMGSPHAEDRFLALSMEISEARAGRFPIITRHGEVPFEVHAEKGGKPLEMPHHEVGGTRPHDNMYALQEHSKHRWGMVVDLDKCTGCSACAVACYAENNIPVVGKMEVARGRELSWIRIEKHLSGEGPTEQMRFLPVMCQQCDNAPCESVCPVFASSHTEDGLNAQIYNRCIGTRYCSNNCPYKVRRFNYFDYEREKPGNEQLNPDVTVRSKGVMEKCTFCVQRIREVQNRIAVSKEPLQDGDIVPACVQTCPTGALSFGDYHRPDWVMSKLARDPRGYRLLDYAVNTRPGVVYLRKVDTEKPGKKG